MLTITERKEIVGRLLGYTHDIQMEAEGVKELTFKCVKCGKRFHTPVNVLGSMTLIKWWMEKEKEPCIK